MNPLIGNFTKNLKPCSGCGTPIPWQLIPTKNDTMQFAIQIVVEANSLLEAAKQFEGKGEIISINLRPQNPVPRPPMISQPKPA